MLAGKSDCFKPPLHFGRNMLQGEDACLVKNGKAITSSESPEPGDSGKEKKLKMAARNMSSGSCLPRSDSSGSMTRLNCGWVSVIGRRRVMEVAVTVAPGLVAGEYEFFAAYDGRGGGGARVANACRERLHHLLAEELEVNSGDITRDGIDWTKVMKACFSKMDKEVLIDQREGGEVGEAERAVWSAALVVMVGKEELVVANCGDSRAVLCRGGVATPLSNDHKAERLKEKERMEAGGGRVIGGWEAYRVRAVVDTSRSIGNHHLKPEVTVNKRTDSDDFLIIATDGLWNVVSSDVACDVVRRYLIGRNCSLKEPGAVETEAAAILAELAIGKRSGDNISVIVVDLKQECSKISKT